MSRVESPFHAIAAQAQDDSPVELNVTPFAAAGNVTAVVAGPAATANGDPLLSRQEPPAGADSRSEEMGKNCATEEEADNGGSRQERNVSVGTPPGGGAGDPSLGDVVVKKPSKKRTNNVWTKTTSRKSAKKSNVKNSGIRRASDAKDDTVLLQHWHKEDDANYPIFLSKHNKAEKIELSDDRCGASGSKGYRMVRATRGVVEGAWYFEITVVRLGKSGHARLGWSTGKGDIQAPVGYDQHSYSFRDVDGSKVHAALREAYADAYHENDVIGFYINLPRDESFSGKADEEVVGYKGQPYVVVVAEEQLKPLKPVPGSEILFFKNGVNQGVAFRDINDGVYYPAASMYTLPGDEPCKVLFNFGPDFKYPVSDFGGRLLPNPMTMAPPPRNIETNAYAAGPTEVTDLVEESVDGQNKQQVGSMSAGMEHDNVVTTVGEEIAPKHVEKGPPMKKKAKVSKPSVTSDLPPSVPRKLMTGESRANSDSKTGMSHKMPKNGSEVLKSPTVPIQKRSKKVGSGAEVPRTKAIQNGNKKYANFSVPVSSPPFSGSGLQAVKKLKKLPQGAGLLVAKGSKKDKLETGQSNMNGTDLVNVKRKKMESSKTPVKNVKSVAGGRGGLVAYAGSRNFQGTKRPLSIAESHNSKATKRPIAGAGVVKRSVKDVQASAEHRGDYSPSTSPAFRPQLKGVRPPGSGFMGNERGYMAGRWLKGLGSIPVAVDVLETPNRSA